MTTNCNTAHMWTQLVIIFSGILMISGNGVIQKLLTIRTCGKPNIQNIMNNVTASPGQSATFKCQVDMSCIVAYIEWYHEMDNGTEKLIKTASSSGDPHVHVIKQVKSADEGLYTCIAGNVLGQATASAYLEVNGAPSWHQCTHTVMITSLLSCCMMFYSMFYSSSSLPSSSISPLSAPTWSRLDIT